MPDQTSQTTPALDIDAILALVRAELPPVEEHAGEIAGGGQRGRAHVPLLDFDEDGAVLERDTWRIEDFEALDEEDLVRLAYAVVLGRAVDDSGLAHFLPALREGHVSVVGILCSLRFSAEGEARGLQIPGLKRAWYLERLARAPLVGRVFGPLLRTARRSREIGRLHRRIAAADKRSRAQRAALMRDINASLTGARRSFVLVENELARTDALAHEGLATARRGLDGLENAAVELAAARRMVADQTMRLAALVDRAGDIGGEGANALAALDDHNLDALYVAFENRFRGSTAEIGERQARYLDMMRLIEPVAAGGTVLDVGCGRGEWLALLKAGNIDARGIDTNVAMAEQARGQGLDVTEGDAIAHLRTLPDGSLAAITAFHVVEHLPFRALVALFDEALRVLAPGGAVLFETPNPENLVVGACTFNYDPTHMKPLPPDLLRFLAEARGYGEARIIRTPDDCLLDRPESGFAPAEINDWFRQPPDYALFARKHGPA
ncbi:class I SAM-dependent methyltransferase [Mesorhizobium sp. CAU 1741]|uniref:class I SAM-dependent methyltransferase n=1 Tax=Mesorhizobium sp. CAU 1741 TaxID=3140366 RepID=UPI00325B4970